MATVIDNRDDMRGQMFLANSIGQGLGAMFQQIGKNAELKKERQAENLMAAIIAEEGLTPDQRNQRLATVPDMAQTELGRSLIAQMMNQTVNQADPAYQLRNRATEIGIAGDVQEQGQKEALFPGVLAEQEQGLKAGQQKIDYNNQIMPLNVLGQILGNEAQSLQNQETIDLGPTRKKAAQQGIERNQQVIDNANVEKGRDAERYETEKELTSLRKKGIINDQEFDEKMRPLLIDEQKNRNAQISSQTDYYSARAGQTGNPDMQKAYGNAMTQMNKALDQFGEIKPGFEAHYDFWSKKANEYLTAMNTPQDAPQSTQNQTAPQAGQQGVVPQAGMTESVFRGEKYTKGQTKFINGRYYKIVGFSADGTPLVDEGRDVY